MLSLAKSIALVGCAKYARIAYLVSQRRRKRWTGNCQNGRLGAAFPKYFPFYA